MNSRRTSLWLAMAAAQLLASGVRGQDDFGFDDETAPPAKPPSQNYLEFGLGFTENGNGKFGEYGSGLNGAAQREGVVGVGGFGFAGVGVDGVSSWNIEGTTGAGRLLQGTLGTQGDYGLSFWADQVEKVEYGHAHSVLASGGNVLLLPPGYVPGSAAGQSTRDLAWYGEDSIAARRRLFGLDAFKDVGDLWGFSVELQNQQKNGDDLIAGSQGFNGTSLLPEPIEYNTDQLKLRADYAGGALQNGIEAYVSKFSNGNDSLLFQNPSYAKIGTEQIDLEPDNEFLRVGIDGGVRIGESTRLGWFADWSRGRQDDSFLPVVLDTAYYTGERPFPQKSLHGEVERQSLRLLLTGRPLARFDYRASLDYRNRESRHNPLAVQEISYNGTIPSELTSTHFFDKQSTGLDVEGGYHLGAGLHLRGGWEYEAIDRDTQETDASFTDATDEHRFWVELRLPQMRALSLRLRAEHGELDADISPERSEHVHATDGTAYRALPVFLVDRSESRYTASTDYQFTPQVVLNASLDWLADDYDNSAYGIESRESRILNLAASWSPSEVFSLSLYGTHENYEVGQLGLYTPVSTPGSAEWKVDSEDSADTIGLTLAWTPVPGKIEANLDYSWMDADSDYASSILSNTNNLTCSGYPNFSGLCVGSMPGSSDQLQRADLNLVYHYSAQLDISGRWLYEHRRMNDWAWQDTVEYAAPLAFYWSDPEYSSHLVVVALRFRF